MRKVLAVALLSLALCACSGGGDGKDGAPDGNAADGRGELSLDSQAPDGECCPDGRPEGRGGDGTGELQGEDARVEPGGFEPFSVAPAGQLNGVWGNDQSIIAVGNKGAIIRRQGAAWTPMRSPVKADLFGIWGGPGDEVLAVGDEGTILRYDGKTWEAEETGIEGVGDVAFRGVWGAEGDFYVVGDNGWILHRFDGKWKKEESYSSYDLQAVWGASVTDIYVAGGGGTIFRRIGGGWSTEQVAQGWVNLYGLYGLSAVNIWGGGSKGTIIVHGGAGWSPEISNDPYDRTVRAAWAFSEDQIWLLGTEGLLIRNQPEDKWGVEEIAGPYYKNFSFYGLWGRTGETNEAWGVGEKGAVLHYDGTAWVDEASSPQVDISDIAGQGFDNVLAVGGDGLLLRFDGERWFGLDRPGPDELRSAAWFDPFFVAVGADGTILRIENEDVQKVESGPLVSFLGVCAGQGKLAAVGEQGKLALSTDGATWEPVSTGLYDALRDCSIDGDGAVTVVGDKGKILRVEEGQATAVPVATLANLHRIADDGAGNLYVVGDNGLILRNVAGGWEKVHEEPGLFLYGIHAFADRVLAVGWAGRVITLDPASGQTQQSVTPEPGILLQVWGADPNHVFVVGKKGKMLKLVNEE
jgi:hypothetical protein